MRVLLESTAASRPGHDRGIGRYLSAVVSANDALGNEVVATHSRVGTHRLSELTVLAPRSFLVARESFDVFHAPTAYYTAVDLRRRPSVASILDVIPLDVAGYQRTGAKARVFHRLAARSDAVLTLSEHAAGRIVDVLGVDRERIVVAPLPPAPAFVPDGPRREGLPEHYAAMLVDLRVSDPRKRADWMTPIARRLAAEGSALVLVGGGTENVDLQGVTGLGKVSDDEWASVLRGADVLVYTSAYEGQGMPPLEALACGTPVVAMSNTAVPEVVGSAGILVEERLGDRAPEALADAALTLLRDGGASAEMAPECLGQASTFSAARFSRGVESAYRTAREVRGV